MRRLSCQIAYDFNFEGRRTVYIDGGPGVVPANGTLSYLTRSLHLDFLDSPGGKPIVTVPLKVTFVPAGDQNEALLPKEDGFPSAGQDGEWQGDSLKLSNLICTSG